MDFDWDTGIRHIRKADKNIAAIIRKAGKEPFPVKRYKTPFQYLSRAIIFQQLAGAAARTIHGRFESLFPNKRQITAANLMKLKDDRVRSAGVSRNKLQALRSLAQHALDGEIPGWAKLARMQDDEIIVALTAVHGIGVWTAEMLLLFQLGRPNVLPVGDLGVRNGFAVAHGMKEAPTPKKLQQLAASWAPFSSVGTWYCWRAVDLQRGNS
ncbi:MAG: DNA-3-methyladenine glycosylase family protein [Planctomycetota bacterium]|jgi:3-methyladenine DNA glycosylase/8-oxoguanine DNA glycosylase